jgi:DNA-binding NtrC family response regulator
VPHSLIGRSEATAALRRLIAKAARHRLPVLLLGETGTGKEVVARAIFDTDPRGQFVPIDCGSLVGTLMESELFGHVKGAFTGASDNRKGLVELADGGTAFFDEIGDLPLELQVKLLRLLQESEFRPVGALHWRKVDLRIIAATHRDLPAMIAAGRFREDLYYRLNVFSMRLPPLRDRREDIAPIAEHFVEECKRKGLRPFELTDEILGIFQTHDWPGNVRELKHSIERIAAMLTAGAAIASLPTALQYHLNSSALHQLSTAIDSAPVEEFRRVPKSPVISIPESERQTIRAALTETRGERSEAAKILGIGRTTLYRKMKQYGIS